MSTQSLCLILFCILAETGRELCFKAAAVRADTVWKSFFSLFSGLGVVLWAIELITWTRVLVTAPLSVAFPIMCASYATIAFFGAWLFREKVTVRHACGIALIVLGAAVASSASATV